MSALNPGLLGYKAVMSCLNSIPNGSEVVLHLDPGDASQSTELRTIDDSRFRLIETPTRIGFAEGLNLAISNAKFDLIARHDADDIALPWRWNYQIKKMRSVDFHFGSMLHLYRFAGIPTLLPHYPVSLNHEQFSAVAIHQNPGFHPAVMFKRQAFLGVGGYRKALAEDYDLWLRMLSAGKLTRRDLLPVTVYRHHPNQSTADPQWEQRVNHDPFVEESRKELQLQSEIRESESVLVRLFASQPLSRIEFRKLRRTR